MTTSIRLIQDSDSAALTDLVAREAVTFARWEPARRPEYYTRAGQDQRIELLLSGYRSGTGWPGVIVDDGVVVGQVSISNVMHGPFQRGFLGYWVTSAQQGRGHARRAVSLVLKLAVEELGLHKMEAHTQLDNLASQHVLRGNGFKPFGVAHDHIYIDGAWRDDIFWERTLDDGAPRL